MSYKHVYYHITITYHTISCHCISYYSMPLFRSDGIPIRSRTRHFCDDPVCPDPVWKPAIFSSRGLWNTEERPPIFVILGHRYVQRSMFSLTTLLPVRRRKKDMHKICCLRFVSDWTQPLDILSADSELVCYYLSKKGPGQPNPWNKSWTANSCYANWVYIFVPSDGNQAEGRE